MSRWRAGLGRHQRQRLSLGLALGLAVILLGLALRSVSWSEVATVFWRVRLPLVGLALGVLSLSLVVRAGRWQVLLTAAGPVRLPVVLWGTVIGYLGNSYLPARAGELIRSLLLARGTGLTTSFVLATALSERIVDALLLVLVALIAVSTVDGVPEWLRSAIGVMGLVSSMLLVGVLVLPGLINSLGRWLEVVGAGRPWLAKGKGVIEQFGLGLRALHHHRRALLFLLATIGVWGCDVVFALVVAASLDLSLSLVGVIMLLAALGLASVAPATPGALGIYQLVAVTVLPLFGLSASEGLAYIVVFQGLTYVAVTIWGLIGLAQLRLSPARVMRVAP